jgi:hypothetical protein
LADTLQIHLDLTGEEEELRVQYANLKNIQRQMGRQQEPVDLPEASVPAGSESGSEESEDWESLNHASSSALNPNLRTKYEFPFPDYPIDISRGRAFKSERLREKHEFDCLWVVAHKAAQGLNTCRQGSMAFQLFKDILSKAERRIVALTQWNDISYQFVIIFDGYAEQRGVEPLDAFYKAKIQYAKELSRVRSVSKGPVAATSSGPVGAPSSSSVSSSSRFSGGSARFSSSSSGYNGSSSSVTPKGGKGNSGTASTKQFAHGSCFSCGSWEHWAHHCPRPKGW